MVVRKVNGDGSRKYEKIERVPPKGYDSANDFFEDVFMDKDMVWMGQNTNHLHGDIIADAMANAVMDKEFCKYPPPEGFSELKELILNDLGLDDSFQVLLTAGATESLYLSMNALLGPNDNVITSDPGYLIIGSFAERFAGEVIYVPIYSDENNYKLTPELVEKNMNENTKMIILIDPLNPLGTSYNQEEIKKFARIAKENDIYLIHDITYKDFARKHYLAADYAPENTLTIYSFSKIFAMAGERIGGVISTSQIIDKIKNVVINDLGVNVVAQEGAIAGLKSKDSWIGEIKDTTFKNQELIKKTIDNIDGVFLPVFPTDANMMAIDISQTGIDPKELSDYLLKHKIFTRQGDYTSRLFGDRYLRVSFSVPTSEVELFCEEFPKAIEVLGKK